MVMGLNVPDQEPKTVSTPPDFSFENGLLGYTAAHHFVCGQCCGSGCRHCRQCHSEPKHITGSTKVHE